MAPDQTNLSTNLGQAPTTCRGQVCENEPFIGGTIKSSPSFLSTEILTESLNAYQLSNPNFYQNLQSQKFYKITKETPTGFKIENIFYKQ